VLNKKYLHGYEKNRYLKRLDNFQKIFVSLALEIQEHLEIGKQFTWNQ